MAKPKYDDEYRASAVLMLEAAGYPNAEGALSRTAAHLGIPAMTLKRWADGTQNPPPNRTVRRKKIDLAKAIDHELASIFAAMETRREEASYRDLTVAAGILTDKQQLIAGKPTQRIETIEGWLNELPQSEYDAVIAEAQRIIGESGGGDFGSGETPGD